jgi:hypothetical protein
MNNNEIDSFKETEVKHVFRFVTVDDRCYYKFEYETSQFDEEEFETIEEAKHALDNYVEYLNMENS